ncbi:BRO1-like domain containing protein [Novymonas esmeraldas]|uniref:BRO1-like domain containing protein n=1 Tax=Novymonas esmeraldas TaxID=1808958 RepID=A0AAW0EKC0_9TRYP
MFNSDTLKYVFPTIPVRQTKKPGVNSQIEVDVSSADKKELAKRRDACIDFFEDFRKHLGRKGNAVDEKLSTSAGCEKYVKDLVDLVDAYTTFLASVVSKTPNFASIQYYYWSSSLTDKQEMAFDDYRYELLGIYYNVGAVLATIAQYLLCVRVTVGTLAILEKDAYRALVKASAYFHMCATITDNMKEHEIGVAQVPIPLDVDKGMSVFLESLVLAQAQEIGVSKAFAADPKEAAETTARLSHQLFLMYEGVCANARSISTRNETFVQISTLVVVKCDIFRALAYQHGASHLFNKSPGAGLTVLSQGLEHARIVEDYFNKSQKGKLKLPFNGERFVGLCNVTVKNNAERLNKINSLVHRAKPDAVKASLPPPQPLATRPDMALPFNLEG